jgi:RimJ/RimL family protein N-acetyltransferase
MAAFPARDKDSFMTHWTKIMADKTLIAMTVLFNGQVAGNIVCWEQEGQRLVGYWIGKNYWGKGIATKALSQFLLLVKSRPLYAHVARHNIGSIRVLEKCGFTLSGEGSVSAGDPGLDVEELIMVAH